MKIWMFVLAMASAACTAPQEPLGSRNQVAETQDKSYDGRSGSTCPGWAKDPSVQLCSPSIVRLVARGEDYDGQLLKLTGFVMRADGVAYLCPDMHLCGEGDWSSAIQLPGSKSLEGMGEAEAENARRVTVIGKYSATTRGRRGQVGGAFMSIEVVYPTVGPP